MPLGGLEATGECEANNQYNYHTYVAMLCCPAGYKGYGLAMMVEVMCGMMGGGMYAHHIRKWTGEDHRPADLVSPPLSSHHSCH